MMEDMKGEEETKGSTPLEGDSKAHQPKIIGDAMPHEL